MGCHGRPLWAPRGGPKWAAQIDLLRVHEGSPGGLLRFALLGPELRNRRGTLVAPLLEPRICSTILKVTDLFKKRKSRYSYTNAASADELYGKGGRNIGCESSI